VCEYLLNIVPTATTTPEPTSNCEPAPSGLASWWPGDGSANDRVNGNHGIPKSGATFAPGLVGQAFSLGGTSHVEVPDSPSLDITGAIAVEVWVKPNSLSKGAIIAKHDSSTDQVSYGMQVQPGGLLQFFVSVDGTTIPGGARTKLSDNSVVPAGT